MIARRALALVLAPALACASFETEIIEPVHPSLAAGALQQTSFELDSQPSSTTTTTSTTQPSAPVNPQPGTPGTPATGTAGTTSTTTTTATPSGAAPVASVSAGPAPAGAATAPRVGDEATVDQVVTESDKAQRRRNAALWAGVTLAALGTAGTIAFGVTGRITQGQIAKGYDDDSLTRAREDDLERRGKAMNIGAATSFAVGLFGIAMFSIVLGVDYVRCGKLTTKKRKDCVPRRRR